MGSAATELAPDQDHGLTVTARPGLISDDLAGLNAGTAKGFLALSNGLQAIAGVIREITVVSRQVSSLAGVGESDQAVATLQQVLGEVSQLQSLGQASRQELHQLLSELEKSRVPLSRLTKVPSLLNTVGMLSRVEASRLEGAAVNVSSLTADMDRLSRDIEGHVSTMVNESDKLTHLFARSVHRVDEVEEQERLQAADLVSQSRSLLDSFHDRAHTSHVAAQKIDEQYAAIRQDIDRIVTKLQSEDIARQRIEHIQEALRGAPAADTEANKKEAAEILHLQALQLLSTRTLIAGSVTGILDGLRALSLEVEALTSEVAGLAVTTDENGQSFAATIRSRMASLCAVFDQYFGSARAILSTVDAVLPSLAGMTTAVAEVEDIQASIRLMALNAEIKTAQLGAAGAAMGVLASELHRIKERSDGDTHGMLQSLKAMETLLKALTEHHSVPDHSIIMSSGGDDLSQQVDGLVATVVASAQAMAQQVTALQHMAIQLNDRIRNAVEIAEQTGTVTAQFDAVLQQLEHTIEDLGGAPVPELCEGGNASALAALYSMQSEREVHEEFYGTRNNGSGNAPAPAGDGEDSSDLGDNVELF